MAIYVRCHICGTRVEQYTMATCERYTDSGMTVDRYCLCDEHMTELRAWFEATENEGNYGSD